MTRLWSIALLIVLAAPALAQDCDEPTPAQMMEGQQKMMALMGPGPEHELLTRLVGEWGATMNMHVPGMDTMSSPRGGPAPVPAVRCGDAPGGGDPGGEGRRPDPGSLVAGGG
jgi:hypothetical protein